MKILAHQIKMMSKIRQPAWLQFESLDLPPLPADRSNFNVHGALEDDKVNISKGLYYTYYDIYMY